MISGHIESLAFGGKGILRHEGLVLFVPYTVPGDQIICRIVKQHKNYADAELVAIEKPSPHRVEPRCPYFGTCGGCQLQHLDEKAQLDYKRSCVREALARIGGFREVAVDPVIPADRAYAYRRHVTLTLKEDRGHFVAGYIATNQRTLIPVTECPIFVDSSQPLLRQVQALANLLQVSRDNEGKVTILKRGEGYFLQWHFKRLPINATELIEKSLINHPEWIGSSIATPKSLHRFGDCALTWDLDGLSIHFSPRAFIQNYPEQSLNIYRLIQELAKEQRASQVLDLYCGIGISSLLLARQDLKVTGVERCVEAIKMARANASANRSQVEFVRADVKVVLKKLLETLHPDFVLANPPREGMEEAVIEELRHSNPATIAYLSCMPTTLARDLKMLCPERYRISRCQPFDMFPQTAHVETLTLCSRL